MSKDIEIAKKSSITITSFGVLLGIVGTISYAFGYMYDLGYLSRKSGVRSLFLNWC